MKKIFFFLFIFMSTFYAQERNSWNMMGGSRSALMGGIVIGGVRDNSAPFYNPGALGFISTSSHSISSDIYSYTQYRIKDGSGSGLDLVSNQFITLPLMASGILSLDFLIKELKIGYVLLTRNSSVLNFTSRIEKYQDLIPDNPNGVYIGNDQFIPTFVGKENVRAQYIVDQSSEEIWGGGSLSYMINDNWSLGVSGFGVYNTYSFRENINVFATDTALFRTASNSILNYQDVWSLSILIKFGIAYQKDFLKLGLTITSPQISFYGHSKVAGILNSQNVLQDKDNQSNIVVPIDFTADERQQDLNTKFIKPFSVGFGAEFAINKKLNLSIAAEYFAPLSEYIVAQPPSKSYLLTFGNNQSFETNSSENLKIVNEYKAILNYGIAFEYIPLEKLKTYFSFRTDFNNGVFKMRNNYYLGFSEWDIYHLTLGATFIDDRSNFSIGLAYNFSFDKNYDQLVNFNNLHINDSIFLFGRPGKGSINYQEISVILGYTYNLE